MRKQLVKREVMLVTPPAASWTIDLDSDTDMGAQLKNEPITLVKPCWGRQV